LSTLLFKAKEYNRSRLLMSDKERILMATRIEKGRIFLDFTFKNF